LKKNSKQTEHSSITPPWNQSYPLVMTTLVVAAIIQDSEHNYLCAKRGDWKQAANKWEFPGGKPEANELLEDAIMREIREELGVEITVQRLFDRTTTGDIELVTFVCDLLGAKPTHSTDHSELRWVPESELSKLDWAEPDLPALKRILIPFC
jgi:8-oxo-dGTP diphosphatase